MKIWFKITFILSLFINIFSSQELNTSDPVVCERRYREAVAIIIKDLQTKLKPQILEKANRYINLTLDKAKVRHNIEVIERTFIPQPELQGILRTPYEKYSHCLREKLLTPQMDMSDKCKTVYLADIETAITNFKQFRDYASSKPEKQADMLNAARQYIEFVEKQSAVDEQKLLLERNTDIDIQTLQGKLFEPFNSYLRCLDPKIVVPLIGK